MSGLPLLVDVDTGVDDAMALALASTLNRHELVGVTTVAGNVGVERSTDNTLRVLHWIGSDVPVYRGMSAPLNRPLYTATHVHGDDGLGGWRAPVSSKTFERMSGPEAMIRLASEFRGAIVFACVGPLTNLAVALKLEPRLVEWISRLVIMGGAFFKPGNVTEHAEFNIYVDPEAASTIAQSNFKATWVGLDVTHETTLDLIAWQELEGSSFPNAQLVREVARQAFGERKQPSVALHDPLAVAVVEDPGLIESESGIVVVDQGEYHRGETRLAFTANQQVVQHVANSVDSDRFSQIFGRFLA